MFSGVRRGGKEIGKIIHVIGIHKNEGVAMSILSDVKEQ